MIPKIFKKIVTLFLIAASLQMLFVSGSVIAIDPPVTPKNNAGVSTDQLLYPFNYKNGTTSVSLVKNLPSGTPQEIIIGVIKLILSVCGVLALVSFTVAGVMFLTAAGQEEKITKAKHMILWSIGALAIIAISYAIVTGVSQLQFFTSGSISPPPAAPAAPAAPAGP